MNTTSFSSSFATFGLLGAVSFLALTGCSPGPGASGPGGEDEGGGNTSGVDDDDIDLGTDDVAIGEEPAVVDDERDLDVREKVCDESGENCTCLRMALLGTLASAANDTDTQPFVDWLNNNSDGTATVTTVSTQPTLDDTFLSQYDVLLVANVNGWTFSDAEKAAVAAWSKETGGGIVSLTGFISKDSEEVFTSQLIEFSGISYASTPAAVSEQSSVDYQGVEVPMYCAGDALITTAVPFTPLEGSMEALTFALTYAGAYRGYAVNVPEDGTTVAIDPSTGEAIAAAKEVDGAGRVFAWGDEWAIFANQWTSEPVGEPSTYNQCYYPAEGSEGIMGEVDGEYLTVSNLYQVKQFWYNVINWVAPPSECGFTIEDEDVVVIIR